MRGPGSGNRTDGGCTDGQTVDESIHRSEGGYGWGGEAMRAQLSLSLMAGMREGSFSLSPNKPPSLLQSSTSYSIGVTMSARAEARSFAIPSFFPSSPSSAIMSLMSWRKERGTQWSISPSCLKGTSSSILLFLSTSNATQKPLFVAYRTSSYPSHLLVLRGRFRPRRRNHGSVNVIRCACGGVDVVRRQTDEQRSAANAMR